MGSISRIVELRDENFLLPIGIGNKKGIKEELRKVVGGLNINRIGFIGSCHAVYAAKQFEVAPEMEIHRGRKDTMPIRDVSVQTNFLKSWMLILSIDYRGGAVAVRLKHDHQLSDDLIWKGQLRYPLFDLSINLLKVRKICDAGLRTHRGVSSEYRVLLGLILFLKFPFKLVMSMVLGLGGVMYFARRKQFLKIVFIEYSVNKILSDGVCPLDVAIVLRGDDPGFTGFSESDEREASCLLRLQVVKVIPSVHVVVQLLAKIMELFERKEVIRIVVLAVLMIRGRSFVLGLILRGLHADERSSSKRVGRLNGLNLCGGKIKIPSLRGEVDELGLKIMIRYVNLLSLPGREGRHHLSDYFGYVLFAANQNRVVFLFFVTGFHFDIEVSWKVTDRTVV